MKRNDPTASMGKPGSIPPPPESWQARPGTTIGDFRLIRPLGEGGMGSVWEAEEVSLQRRVALKLIRPERVDKASIQFFEREARAGGQLQHPGIVALYGAGESDGVHYIVLELIEDGNTLANLISPLRDQESVPEDYYKETALRVSQIADAMQVAHDAGVIHRDLKPSNILITPEGLPKVTDFGLARIVGEQSISGSLGVLGTCLYMSPEQAAAKAIGIDHRSDIFSLGSLLYEMLTLRRPFEGDTQQQILEQIIHEDPPYPRQVRSKVPDDLSVICMKAMEKRRAHRYASMAEFAADLRRHLANEPILALPPGPLRRAQKWMLRHPTASTTLGVAAVALVVISVLLVQNIRARVTVESQKNEILKAKEAAEESQRAIAASKAELEVEKDAAERALAILQDMLSSADPYNLKGPDYTVRQMLDDFESSGVLEEVEGSPRVLETVHSTLAKTYRYLGEYDRARRHSETSLQLRLELHGEEHTEVAKSLNILALILEAQDQLAESEKLHREALAMLRRLLGDEHTDVAASLHNLALCLKAQGQYGQSEELQRKALDMLRQLLGDEHPNVAISLGSLAQVLKAQGQLTESEKLHRESLDMHRRLLGDEHPDVALSLNNLAEVLKARGEFGESEDLLREALAVRRRLLGDEHPKVAISLSSLAQVLKAQGQLTESEKLHREALAVRRRFFGAEHPDVALSLNNLAAALKDQGSFAESEKLHRESLDMLRRFHGEEHPHVATVVANLALALEAQGRFAESEKLLREALEMRRRLFGDEHRDTLESTTNLEYLLRDQLDRARQAVKHEPGHQLALAQSLTENAVHQLLQKDLIQAETYVEEALELLLEEAPTWQSTRLRSKLGLVVAKLGRPEEAEELVLESAEWVLMRDELMSDGSPASDETKATDVGVEVLEHALELYEAWHTAQPDAGYDEEAKNWREELDLWAEEHIASNDD